MKTINTWIYVATAIMFCAAVYVAVDWPNHTDELEDILDVNKQFDFTMVSNTEYAPGQTGQVIVEARYMDGSSAIDDNIILVYGNVSAQSYDNATIDKINDNAPVKWVPYLDSSCIWDWNYGRYICGCSSPSCATTPTNQKSSMRRVVDYSGQLLGFKTDLTLGIYGYCSGGSCYTNNAWAWLGDSNTTMSTSLVGYAGMGSDQGLSLDLNTFKLYRRKGTNTTLLYDATDPVSCAPIVCYGYFASLEMYVVNGRATVVRDGVTIIDVQTDYVPTNVTTYGFYGSRTGSGSIHQAGVVFTDNIYDYVNGTSVIEAIDCKASIWYPDKSEYISNWSMVKGNNGNGYIIFSVPAIDGVYEYQSVCNINNRNVTASKSFHVTVPTTRIRAEVIK